MDSACDIRAVHVVNRCQVGQEVPCHDNRTFVMPRCYVPSGSSSSKEAAARNQGADTETPSTNNEGGGSEATPTTQDTGLYREETGLQYNPTTSLICPFMVLQRTTLDQYFQPFPNISIHTSKDSQAEALPTPVEVLEKGILTAARMASTIPQPGSTHPTPICFSSPYSVSFAAESLMIPKITTTKKASRVSFPEQFVHMDLEVRLGVAAVAPEGVVTHPPKLLSQEQYEYVSRFQLLSDRKTASAEAASVLAPDVNAPDAPPAPAVQEEKVSVVSALALGAFDPFLPATPYVEVQKSLSKMSKGTLSKGREAVLSKTIQPKFQLVFQRRTAIPLAARKDSASTSQETLVLETPDGGNNWYEVVQQNTVSAITTPMINSTNLSLESVVVAKHLRVCTVIEEEWATYYLHNLFCESMKFKKVAGVDDPDALDEAAAEEQAEEDVKSSKGKAKGAKAKKGAIKHMSFQSLSAVGFLHPESSTSEMRSLVKRWQLVSLEKTELSLAHCIDSGEVLPTLPRTVHTRGVFDDLDRERKFCHAYGSEVDITSSVTPAGGGTRSNLFVSTWMHTTTHYIDDGTSFLRGDTTFRRRLTFSNPALHNALSVASVTAAKPMFVDKIHLPTRLSSAIHSVTNEGLNLLTHRLGVGPISGSVLMDLISDTIPAFVFPSDRGSQQADAIAVAPPVATPVSSKRPSPTIGLISIYKQAIQAGMQLSTAIAIRKHAGYLSEHTLRRLPTVAIAQASAFHAVIPWHLVRFPIVLNSFHGVKIPANIPFVGTVAPTPAIEGDARFSNALALSTALLRNRGASLLFVSRKAVMTSNELAAFDAGILSPEALKLPPVSMDVFEELTTQRPLSYQQSELCHPRKTGSHRDAASEQGMENLLRMKIPQAMERLGRAARLGGSKVDTKMVFEAPVFCANFGSDQSSFAVESLLRRALPRILGKSIKTTVSAITLSDLPSKTLKAMDASSRQHALDVLSPLGTRYVTSVFLDSKDASKSFVMDISKRASGPFAQELLVQTVLRRMMAPSSLRLGQVNVQTSGGPDEDEVQRELWEADSQNVDRAFYRLDWVPEDALNVFRGSPSLIMASITQDANRVRAVRGDVSTTTAKAKFEGQLAELGDDGRKEHLDDLRKNNARFNHSLTTGGTELSIEDQQIVDADVSGFAYKGLISSAVNISKVLLDNTRPVKIAELLEAQVKWGSVFAYLPQLLDALALDGDGVSDAEANKKKLERLLTRDMSRVIFAEDRTFRAEGVMMGNTSAPGSTPAMFVVSRTIHDISTGVDGVARYETNTMLFFTTRDPAIIVGGNGDLARLEGLLGKDGGGASSESLVIEEALHVFRNLGRWMVDNTFASPAERDVVEKEGETSAGRSVQDVLKGWTDSALARQSSDVLEMVQGDEKLAANRLTHVLVHAARLSGEAVEATCRTELLHWIGALGSAAGVITVKDLEHAYIHSQLHLVLRRCGIPLKPSSMFFSKVQHELLKERGENPARANADPHLMILPCDTYCRLTKELVLRVGLGDKGGGEDHDNSLKSTLVPIFLPSTLHTSDGMIVPEGTLAFVGHASTQLIRECGHFFGDLVALHQVGDFLMIPATEDVDVQVGVELSNVQDQVWKSPMESQFVRMKTLEGHPVVMKRNRFGQFAPPSLFERTFIEGAKLYQIPTVGAPLYREGKLVTFNKGVGTHSFVSSVLRTGNMRKMISYLAKK